MRHVLHDPDLVRSFLDDDRLDPPGRPDWPDGTVARLRASMARFSAWEIHDDRRRTVEAVIAELDPEVIADAARRRSRAVVDVALVPDTVPVLALAEGLGLLAPGDDGSDLVAMVAEVSVAVVDDATPSAEADHAAACLHQLATDLPADSVTVISILHQARAATAALIRQQLVGDDVDASVVPFTERVARHPLMVDERPLGAGDELELRLDASLQFGHGRHGCPGRELAERLARTIVDELRGPVESTRLDP